MAEVTIRDLRNHGGEVIDRVVAGEHLTVTRAGKPVAELHPVPRKGMTAALFLERWSMLPPVDPAGLRADIDELIDPTL